MDSKGNDDREIKPKQPAGKPPASGGGIADWKRNMMKSKAASSDAGDEIVIVQKPKDNERKDSEDLSSRRRPSNEGKTDEPLTTKSSDPPKIMKPSAATMEDLDKKPATAKRPSFSEFRKNLQTSGKEGAAGGDAVLVADKPKKEESKSDRNDASIEQGKRRFSEEKYDEPNRTKGKEKEARKVPTKPAAATAEDLDKKPATAAKRPSFSEFRKSLQQPSDNGDEVLVMDKPKKEEGKSGGDDVVKRKFSEGKSDDPLPTKGTEKEKQKEKESPKVSKPAAATAEDLDKKPAASMAGKRPSFSDFRKSVKPGTASGGESGDEIIVIADKPRKEEGKSNRDDRESHGGRKDQSEEKSNDPQSTAKKGKETTKPSAATAEDLDKKTPTGKQPSFSEFRKSTKPGGNGGGGESGDEKPKKEEGKGGRRDAEEQSTERRYSEEKYNDDDTPPGKRNERGNGNEADKGKEKDKGEPQLSKGKEKEKESPKGSKPAAASTAEDVNKKPPTGKQPSFSEFRKSTKPGGNGGGESGDEIVVVSKEKPKKEEGKGSRNDDEEEEQPTRRYSEEKYNDGDPPPGKRNERGNGNEADKGKEKDKGEPQPSKEKEKESPKGSKPAASTTTADKPRREEEKNDRDEIDASNLPGEEKSNEPSPKIDKSKGKPASDKSNDKDQTNDKEKEKPKQPTKPAAPAAATAEDLDKKPPAGKRPSFSEFRKGMKAGGKEAESGGGESGDEILVVEKGKPSKDNDKAEKEKETPGIAEKPKESQKEKEKGTKDTKDTEDKVAEQVKKDSPPDKPVTSPRDKNTPSETVDSKKSSPPEQEKASAASKQSTPVTDPSSKKNIEKDVKVDATPTKKELTPEKKTPSSGEKPSVTSSPRPTDQKEQKQSTPPASSSVIEGKQTTPTIDGKEGTPQTTSPPSENGKQQTPDLTKERKTSSPDDIKENKQSTPQSAKQETKKGIDSTEKSKKDGENKKDGGEEEKDPKKKEKKGFLSKMFDNSNFFQNMMKRPEHPSKTAGTQQKTAQKEKGASESKQPENSQHGKKIRPATATENATVIQSAWRGKKTRKWLRVRNIAAMIIQKVYRGVSDRSRYLPLLQSKREKDRLKKQQKERMKSISQKERDLNLLSQLTPEQYMEYDRLKRNISAKMIQNAWRKSEKNPNNLKYNQQYATFADKTKSALRNAKFFPFRMSKDKKFRQSSEFKEDSQEEKKINDRFYKERKKLEELLDESLKMNGSQVPFEPKLTDYNLEENSIRLSQLYQRVRDQASQKITDMKKEQEKQEVFHKRAMRESSQGGMRAKYKELMEVQQKADILLDEFTTDRPYLDYRKAERRKSICTSLELIELLKNPPTLEEAAKTIGNHKNSNIPSDLTEERKQYVYEWIYRFDSEYMDAYLHSDEKPTITFGEEKKAELLQKAMENHLLAMDNISNSTRWDSVFVPVSLEDYSKRVLHEDDGNEDQQPQQPHVRSSREMPSLKAMTKPASLRNLAHKWSTGVDADDSLYWISYATQPSKAINASEMTNGFQTLHSPKKGENGPPPPSTALSLTSLHTELIKKQTTNENYKSMLKEFHLNLINPTKRMEENAEKIALTQKKVNLLAENIEKEIWKEVKYKYFEEFQNLSKKERMEKKMKTIIFIQSRIRGYLQRVRFKKLKQQHRFYMAIQNLLTEMNVMNQNNHPHANHPHRRSGQDSAKSLSTISPPIPPIMTTTAKKQLQTSYDRNIEEIARITSQALRTPYSNSNKQQASSSLGMNNSSILPNIHAIPVTASRDKNATTLQNPIFSRSLEFSSTGTNFQQQLHPQASSSSSQQVVSSTPAKYDQVTVKTPFRENLHLPLPQEPLTVDRGYALKNVEAPLNQQFSARSYASYPNSAMAPAAGGYETPILQTPRGLYTNSNASTLEKAPAPGGHRKISPRPSSSEEVHPPSLIPPQTIGTPQAHRTDKEKDQGGKISHRKVTSHPHGDQELSTPTKQHDTSGLLSPFMDMNEDVNATNGYISSPSQTSLSRSLSVSFGQVTNQISPRAGGAEGTPVHPSTASHHSKKKLQSTQPTTIPFIANEMLPVFFMVEERFENQQLEAAELVRSALAADISHFDKKGAIDFTIGLLKKIPPRSISQWLTQFPLQRTAHAIQMTPSSRGKKNHTELPVDLVSLLLSELACYNEEGGYDDETVQYNLIQFIFLLRLFAAATESGKIKISDLQNYFFEIYVQVLSIQPIHERMESLRIISKLRCYLVKLASKKATIPQKILDGLLEEMIPDYIYNASSSSTKRRQQQQQQGDDPNNPLTSPLSTSSSAFQETEVSVDLIEELLLHLYSMMTSSPFPSLANHTPNTHGTNNSHLTPSSRSGPESQKNLRKIKVLTRVVLEFYYCFLSISSGGQQNYFDITSVPLQEIKELLTSLISYRQLQKKIQTWMRAVPNIFSTIMNGLNVNAESINHSILRNDIFINVLTQSLLPTTNSENRLLADLLQQRGGPATGPGSEENYEGGGLFVDIRLLNRLRNGEFIQALL